MPNVHGSVSSGYGWHNLEEAQIRASSIVFLSNLVSSFSYFILPLGDLGLYLRPVPCFRETQLRLEIALVCRLLSYRVLIESTSRVLLYP